MRRYAMLAATTAVLAAIPFAARAQDAAQSASTGTAADPQTSVATRGDADPSDIIVTARQREESLKDIPIAVTAISGDAIKQQVILAVKDIAAYAPGLNINSDSVGRAFVSIRGVGTTLIDTVQPGVGIFIDGIYQPNTSYLNSPLVDVSRVEVLRGPQGTLFGNNTLGGAINVVTRQPGNDLEIRADGALARPDDYASISGSVSGAIVQDVLQVRVGAAYHHHDGFQKNLLAGGNSNPLTQKSVNGTVRFIPAEWATFTLNGNYDRVRGGNTPYVGATGPRDYTLDNSSNQLSLATITYKGVSLKGEFDADALNTKITAIAAYNRRNQRAAGDGDFGPVDFLRSTGRSRLTTKTGELRFDTQFSDSISTLIGLFASRSTTATFNTTTIVPLGVTVPAISDSRDERQAIFGTVFVKLSPTVDLAVGGRYDHQKLDVSSATTAPTYKANEFQPRVTLTNKWTSDLMSYASVARGVRGGGQNGPGSPNLIYKGDKVWTYEVGTKITTFDRRLSLDLAAFYNDYDDFIGQNSLAPSTTGAGFVAINLNTGHVTSYGFEAEANFRVTDNWRLRSGLTLLHARITNDDQYFATTGTRVSTDHVIFTPDWNFNIGSTYTVPIKSDALVFDGNLIGKGSRFGSSLDPNVAPKLAAYYLVNGSIAYRMASGIEVAAFATNLFNEKYIESYIDRSALVRAGLAAIARNLALPGDRRRYGVRASLRF
jgi:iron complex outermembrane receptor protein